MNDSPPKEPTFDEMVAAAKSQIERDRLYRQIIGRDKPATLLTKQEQGSVIEKQAQTIQRQAETIAHLVEEIDTLQGVIDMLTGESAA